MSIVTVLIALMAAGLSGCAATSASGPNGNAIETQATVKLEPKADKSAKSLFKKADNEQAFLS